MRPLSGTLLSAQRQPSSQPYVKVEVVESRAGVARMAWTRLYTGTEPEGAHAATMPADGSLVRTRVDPAATTLYIQRVASPGPGSDFSQWTSLGTASADAGVALCSRGSRVLAFSVEADGVTITARESTDSGATFSGPTTVVTAPATVGWLAADFGVDDTVAALFYSTSAGVVYVVKRTSGSWGSPSAWSNSAASISGLAGTYFGDWNLAVTGTDSSGTWHVWTCIYGDGGLQGAGTWSSLQPLMEADAGAGFEFRSPSLLRPDVFRLFYVEKYTGTVGYSRPLWSATVQGSSFAGNLWREPAPFNLTSTYGLALVASGEYLWLSMPSGVWRAPSDSAPLDVTADVLAVEASWIPAGAKAKLLLRNDDGRYSSPGSGSLAALQLGSELKLGLGYRSSAGPETSPASFLWVTGWEHISEGGRALLALEAEDGWGLLERWRSRRQLAWSVGQRTVQQLLAYLLARVGFSLVTLNVSSEVSSLTPAFVVQPGESAASALRRLLTLVPDVLFFGQASAYLKHPRTTDTSDYSYGTSHAISRARYAQRGQDSNWVQVMGSGIVGEGFTWSEVETVGERLRQVHDLNLADSSSSNERAQTVLRKAALEALNGKVTVPVNCGQELYDVVEITDARAGLSAARRRVLGLSFTYDCQRRPRYQMGLELGGV